MTSGPTMANPALTDAVNRLELLHTARAVQQAATAGDFDALHDQVRRLRNALVERLRPTQPATTEDLQLRLARHGQQRLLRFIDEILSITHERPGSCTCLVRGAELRSMLIRQLRLETSLTRRVPNTREEPRQGDR